MKQYVEDMIFSIIGGILLIIFGVLAIAEMYKNGITNLALFDLINFWGYLFLLSKG